MALTIWSAMSVAMSSIPLVVALAFTIAIGSLSFFAAAYWLGAFEVDEIKSLIRRR